MSNSVQNQRRGFSLIEMMWQLVILVVVSFPMVMALNLQKQTIEKDETQTRNQVLTNSLFSVVNPNDPDWYHRYQVTQTGPFRPTGATWTSPLNTGRRPSIYCDSANPALNVGTALTACTGTGDNVKRAPFFERRLEVTTEEKLKVTVRLFDKARLADSATPYYESSREFDMVPYRIIMNPTFSSTTTPPSTVGAVQQPGQLDEIGNAWYFNTGIDTAPGGPNTNSWGALRHSTCTDGITPISATSAANLPSVADLTGMPVPYRTYWRLRSGFCDGGTTVQDFANGLSFRFRVSPGTYTVKVHYVIPGSITTGCMAGTANMSCSLANMALSPSDITSATAADVATFNTFDINAAAGPEFTSAGALVTSGLGNKPAVFRTEYTTTSDEIFLYIQPTEPDAGGTSTIYLTGIEVMRKGQ